MVFALYYIHGFLLLNTSIIVFVYAIYTAYVYYALSLHLLYIYIFPQLFELLVNLRVVFL